MKVWLPSVIELFWMDSITTITDMSRKRFGAEPQINATLMPDRARFWPRNVAILDRMFDCA